MESAPMMDNRVLPLAIGVNSIRHLSDGFFFAQQSMGIPSLARESLRLSRMVPLSAITGTRVSTTPEIEGETS